MCVTWPVQELEVEGQRLKFTCVSMGNPHAITYSINGKPIKVGTLGHLVLCHSGHITCPVFVRTCKH